MTANNSEKNTLHSLESLLSGCSRETLIQLLLRQAERDTGFEKLLRLRFSKSSGAEALLRTFSNAIHEMDYADSPLEIAEEILVQAEQPELKGSQWEEPGRQIYEDLLLRMAGNASRRKEYANVCGILKQYEQTCGRKYAVGLAMEIRQAHARQPAFLDELQKIGM